MKKLLLLWVVLHMAVFAAVAEEEALPPPLDPDYMGGHAMVLMTGGVNLFAANLPMYSKPANMQLI